MIKTRDSQTIMEDFVRETLFTSTDRATQEKALEIIIQNAIEKSFLEGRIGGFIVDEQTRYDMREALKAGNKITAIKIFRGATETRNEDGTLSNISLLMSKTLVEQWAKDQGIAIPGNHV